MRKEDEKFLAADPTQDIRFSEGCTATVCKFCQYSITSGMAMYIIDLLKVVDVQKKNTICLFVSFGDLECTRTKLHDTSAVEYAGQCVPP